MVTWDAGAYLRNADVGLTFCVFYCLLLSPLPCPHLDSHFYSLSSNNTPFEASRPGLSPHLTDNHTQEEKLGARSPKGLMANMAQSSAPPAHSWGVLFYLPCCPSRDSCPLASQQDCGLAHHFQEHRSHSGPVSVWNRKMGSQPGIYTAWAEREFSRRFSPVKVMPHPSPVLDPHSGRPRGGGKVFLPREKEKLDSGGRCWLEGGLAIDRLTFHSSPGCSADFPTPGHQSELHILPLAIVSYPGPLGAAQAPCGDNL